MYRLILNERKRCGDWAKARIAHVDSWGDWYEAIGLERDGNLVWVVVFNDYSGWDISMHVAGEGRATREFLKAVFRYPFAQLKCQRVTGYVPASNTGARRLDEHLGFIVEGVKRDALPAREDMIVYGMLREEARRWWE